MSSEDKSNASNPSAKPEGKAASSQPQESSSGPEVSEVEILGKDEAHGEELATTPAKRFNWLPWRRPNPRDHQIMQLREGYIELVDLVKNINRHLDRQQDEATQVSGLVQSLPPVLASFDKLAKSQEQGTAILGRIDTHMAAASKKDAKLMENMDGFNSTIKEVSDTNRGAIGALERVQTKIESSDDRMSTLFEQANKNSDSVGTMMMRLEKRLFFSNLALILLLVLLIGLGIFWSTQLAVKSSLDESRTDSQAVVAETPEDASTGELPPEDGMAPAMEETIDEEIILVPEDADNSVPAAVEELTDPLIEDLNDALRVETPESAADDMIDNASDLPASEASDAVEETPDTLEETPTDSEEATDAVEDAPDAVDDASAN